MVDRYRTLPEDQDPAIRMAQQRAEAGEARAVLLGALPRLARWPGGVASSGVFLCAAA